MPAKRRTKNGATCGRMSCAGSNQATNTVPARLHLAEAHERLHLVLVAAHRLAARSASTPRRRRWRCATARVRHARCARAADRAPHGDAGRRARSTSVGERQEVARHLGERLRVGDRRGDIVARRIRRQQACLRAGLPLHFDGRHARASSARACARHCARSGAIDQFHLAHQCRTGPAGAAVHGHREAQRGAHRHRRADDGPACQTNGATLRIGTRSFTRSS